MVDRGNRYVSYMRTLAVYVRCSSLSPRRLISFGSARFVHRCNGFWLDSLWIPRQFEAVLLAEALELREFSCLSPGFMFAVWSLTGAA